MTDESKSVENQEVATPETDSEVQVQNTHDNAQPAEGSKEYNFSRLREKADKAERKNEELEKEVRELKQAFEEKNAPSVPSSQERDPDDLLTYGDFQRMWAEKERSQLPSKVKNQFSDYDSVMTTENIKKLETEEPGLAQACANAPNPWEATYKILKKFILPSENMQIKKAEEKIKENLSKPISSHAAMRESPLKNANQWGEASREQLYKEMLEASRRAR